MEYGIAIKKPISIDWFKWDSMKWKELQNWVKGFEDLLLDHFNLELFRGLGIPAKLKVKTLEGTSYDVANGYIIIRGVEGEYYPCEPGIFDKTYKIQ